MNIDAMVLAAIATRAGWLKRDGSDLASQVLLLSSRPPFETHAEDVLDQAEAELVRAIEIVRMARAAIADKPVDLSYSIAAE